MTDAYELEKWVWDDGDFDRMGWRDATIHGIVFGPTDFELSLDVDYIFAWVHPVEGEKQAPVLIDSQVLGPAERGGYSFERGKTPERRP